MRDWFDLHQLDAEHIDLKRKGVSDWSPIVEIKVAGDDLAPAAPSISASSADQAIDLVLTKPTTNADGTTCVDFREFKVYHSASSGIDVTNPATYDGYFYTPSTKHTYPATATTYFVATAWDKNGNESAASTEVSATPVATGYEPDVDDYTSNIANVYTGDGMIGIEFQPPKSTWIRGAAWKLYYDVDTGAGWGGTWTLIYIGKGPGFLHKGLNMAYAYKYKLAVLGEGGTETAGTVSDNAGAGYTPNATDNSSIAGVTIFAERVVATDEVRTAHLAAGSVTADKISVTSLSAINADLGAVTAGSIVVGDATNKLWLNDASDGSLAIGGTDKTTAPFRVDSAGNLTANSATISGAITTGSGSSIDGGYLTLSSVTADKISVTNLAAINADLGAVTAGSIVVGDTTNKLWLNDAGDGGLAVGGTDKTVAPFRVDAAGNLTAASATITGTITAQSGSIGAPNYQDIGGVQVNSNLVPNPFFQADDNGDGTPNQWTLGTGWTRDGTVAYWGDYSLKGTGTGSLATSDKVILPQALSSLKISGMAKSDVTTVAGQELASFSGLDATSVARAECTAVQGTLAAFSNGDNRVNLYDISAPASPALLTTISTYNDARPFVFFGNYFACEGTGANTDMAIYDISNPGSPSLVYTYSLYAAPQAAVAYKNHIYVAESGGDVEAIDVTTPSAPVRSSLLTSIDSIDTWLHGYAANDYLVLIGYTVDSNGNEDQDVIVLIDISDPNNIAVTDTDTASLTRRHVVLQGNYLYLEENSGISVYDISDPTIITYITNVGGSASPYYDGNYGLMLTSGYLVNIGRPDSSSYSIAIWDVSSPASPTHVGTNTISGLVDESSAGGQIIAGKDRTNTSGRIMKIAPAADWQFKLLFYDNANNLIETNSVYAGASDLPFTGNEWMRFKKEILQIDLPANANKIAFQCEANTGTDSVYVDNLAVIFE